MVLSLHTTSYTQQTLFIETLLEQTTNTQLNDGGYFPSRRIKMLIEWRIEDHFIASFCGVKLKYC